MTLPSSKGLLTQLRLKIVARLGGKCSGCGYDKDPRVLEVMHQDGDQEYRKLNRFVFYHMLLEAEDLSGYYLLCRNCKFVQLYDKRAVAREAPEEVVVVWQTGFSVYETVARFSWMDQYPGATIYVVAGDGRVYRHGETTPIAEEWETIAQLHGWPVELGDETVVVMKGR